MNQLNLARAIAISLTVAVAAGLWDVWWHSTLGRDSLFQPPHLMLYASAFVSILLALYGWRKFKDKTWMRIGIAQLMIPLSAPFDELWHRIFGAESLNSPLILWSPPHLVLIFGILLSFLSLFPVLIKDKDSTSRLAMIILITVASQIILLIGFIPVQPIGPWHLIGFWGAGIEAAIIVLGFLMVKKLFPSFGSVILCALALSALTLIAHHEVESTSNLSPEHPHPPAFTWIFSTIVVALIIEIVPFLKGAIAGGAWALVFFGMAFFFVESHFLYDTSMLLIAIVNSAAFGFIVSFLPDKLAVILEKSQKNQ